MWILAVYVFFTENIHTIKQLLNTNFCTLETPLAKNIDMISGLYDLPPHQVT